MLVEIYCRDFIFNKSFISAKFRELTQNSKTISL